MSNPPLPITGVFTLLGTVFTGLVVLTLWIWRHTTSLDGEDEDRIRELENDQESSYKAELADLYLNIEQYINNSNQKSADMNRDEYVVNVIERKIEEDDMSSVVSELEDIGTSEELWDSHQEFYKKSYVSFGKAATIIFTFIIVFVIFVGTLSNPFSEIAIIVYVIILFISANYMWEGISYFMQARNKKELFEDSWREYKRVN